MYFSPLLFFLSFFSSSSSSRTAMQEFVCVPSADDVQKVDKGK